MSVIQTHGITKTYRIGVGRARVREMLPWPFDRGVRRLFPGWWARNTFNALEDVSLSVETGSSVGIVGHNGAGKTTLLKVIAGVTEPTHGSVASRGRIAALLDVLVGFHPDLTGTENVYLLGAMQGFSRRWMAERIPQILDFAEVDELAETPLKRFSAGMISRLGFAIFTALDVDILLVDEVLAVGDAAYQRKCIRWLDGYRARGGTLLFVSHNLGLVRSMTRRVVWLDHGRVAADGPTDDVLGQYAKAMEHRDFEAVHAKGQFKKLMLTRGQRRWGAGGARVEEVHIEEPSENGAALEVGITYEVSALESAHFCVAFIDEAGREVGAALSPSIQLERGGGAMSCKIRPLPLRAGIYFPVVAILSSDGRVQDRWQLDRAVVIDGGDDIEDSNQFGPVALPGAWSAGGRDRSIA